MSIYIQSDPVSNLELLQVEAMLRYGRNARVVVDYQRDEELFYVGVAFIIEEGTAPPSIYYEDVLHWGSAVTVDEAAADCSTTMCAGH